MGYTVANDYLAGIRDLENTRLVVPHSVILLADRLTIYGIVFLAGCLIGVWLNDKPKPQVDAMLDRIILRAQLIQQEKDFENRRKDVASN